MLDNLRGYTLCQPQSDSTTPAFRDEWAQIVKRLKSNGPYVHTLPLHCPVTSFPPKWLRYANGIMHFAPKIIRQPCKHQILGSSFHSLILFLHFLAHKQWVQPRHCMIGFLRSEAQCFQVSSCMLEDMMYVPRCALIEIGCPLHCHTR